MPSPCGPVDDGRELPADLAAKVIPLRAILTNNGILQRHRRTWRIRFRSDGRHRSLSLGKDEGHARRIWAVVESWRQLRREAEDAERAQQDAERERAKQRKLERRTFRAMIPGGWRRKKRAVQAYDEVLNAGGPVAALFAVMRGDLWRPRRRGRPRKTIQLW